MGVLSEGTPVRTGIASDGETYFAALPRTEIGGKVIELMNDYHRYLEQSGRMGLYRRLYEAYNTGMLTGGQIFRTGEQGEYTNIQVNHFRNILQHIMVLTTSQRPAWEPRAANTDFRSQTQTILARGVLEFLMREKHIDRHIDDAAETGLLLGDAFLVQEWDVNAGRDRSVNVDGTGVVKEGDVRYGTYDPTDVAFDYTRVTTTDHDWYVVRRYENRYDVAATYPEFRDKVLSVSLESNRLYGFMVRQAYRRSDMIPVLYFYHGRTPACPEGRLAIVIDPDIVPFDGPLPYHDNPVRRICPSRLRGTAFGYSIAFDLLPIQEAVNGLTSVVLTNQSTFGVQNIMTPKGSGLSLSQVEGLNILEYDPKFGPPAPLNLTQTPQEIFTFIEQLIGTMETVAGVNSVVRGNPEASLKSGTALALMQAQAVQFSASFQKSYVQLVEDIGTGLVRILKDFVKEPRIVSIVGRANLAYMKNFVGDDISGIDRVIVDIGNPVMSTVAGKVNMADSLLAKGVIKDASEYLQVVQTGHLDPLIEGQESQLLLVRSENERLAEGQPMTAIITEDHRLHIREHMVVLSNPDAKNDPKVVKTVLDHIYQHITCMKTGDPVILSLNDQPVLAGGSPPSPTGQPPTNADVAGAPKLSPPVPGKAVDKVAVPSLPKPVPAPAPPTSGGPAAA